MNTKRIGILTFVTLAVLAAEIRLRADGATDSNFLVTHFTVDDGLPGSVVGGIAQTPDGFLWLVTGGNNLVRFDGRTFYTFEPRPVALTAATDGDLWIGTREALLRVPGSNFNQFTLTGLMTYHPGLGKETDIIRLRVARDGVLWVGTNGGRYRFLFPGPGGASRVL